MRNLTLDSEIFRRGVADIVTREELSSRLRAGEKLRIKHGIDATAGELHLGHAASLWKIRALQEAGHKAVILFGDITTRIGDPTGKAKARPVLSPDEIKKNIRSIKKQVESILLAGQDVYETHLSSEWYARMRAPEFIQLLSLVTYARLVERDMFRERIRSRAEIFMHELIYPILQGFDSVKLKSDCTVIGQDQLFNEHMGRFFQEKFGQPPQSIIALSILPGLDGGEKMSKSLGNYIGLLDSPQDKFGKAMRLGDAFIIPYLKHYTAVPLVQIRSKEADLARGKNPMEAKLFFAEELVKRYHGAKMARKERERFLAVFSRKEMPQDIPVVKIPHGPYLLLDLLSRLKLARSKSEARRLCREGAVEVDGRVVKDPKRPFNVAGRGITIRVGKRRIVRAV